MLCASASRWIAACLVMLGSASAVAAQEAPAEAAPRTYKVKPIVPTEPIKLFNGKDLTGWYTWLADAQYEDPRGVFKVLPSGELRISGEGYGGIITNDEYANYHLIIEYRWGTETSLDRKDRARDTGLLLHAQGPDGNFRAKGAKPGPWLASIECQIIEGGVGDIIVLTGRDEDDSVIEAAVTAEITRDRDGEAVWTPGGEKVRFTRGRINWYGRDVDWKDVLGFRGKEDIDSPGQEWTRVECFMKDDTLTYLVNGKVVMRGTDITPTQGKILLQTECAEFFVRKLELHPLPEIIP